MKPDQRKNAILKLANALSILVKEDPIEMQFINIETDDKNVFEKVKAKLAKTKQIKSEDEVIKTYSKIDGVKRVRLFSIIDGIQIPPYDGGDILPWDENHEDYLKPICRRCYRVCILLPNRRKLCVGVCVYEYCW